MPTSSSAPSAVSQDDPCGAIPPLPTNKYHLEQLSRDVSKVIEAGEELFKAHKYECHVVENDLIDWQENSERSQSDTCRLQQNDLLKWRVENGLQEWQENSERPMEANLGYAPDNGSPQPIKDIRSYLYHTQETAAAAKELDGIGRQSKRLSQVRVFVNPKRMEEFVSFGKRIAGLWYECDMKRLHVLRERIYRQLELLDKEASPQSSRSTPEDDDALENHRIEKFKKCAPAEQKAYTSYCLARAEKDKDSTDPQSHVCKKLTYKEAYEFLETYDFSDPGLGILWNYELPACFDTWRKQVGTACKALGEQKNQPRGGRQLRS